MLFEDSFVGSKGYVREKQIAHFSHRYEPLVGNPSIYNL